MTQTIYLDASALRGWSDCREFYRQSQILNRTEWPPNIYYHFGIAIHSAIESFWRGESYDVAREIAFDVCNHYPTIALNPKETETWSRMVAGIPDLVAIYFDTVEYDPAKLLMNEKEWSIEYPQTMFSHGAPVERFVEKVILCGRMDRLMVGPRLVDVKTASEIARAGVPWKQDYKEGKLLDFQFGLYDWYLQQVCKNCKHDKKDHGSGVEDRKLCWEPNCKCVEFKSMAPIECYLEVLIKPYRGKKARYEKIDLPEIISEGYRERFKQQLAFKVSEIVHYVENYSDQAPWPLAGGLACSSKYGVCPFRGICAWGEVPHVMKNIVPRIEHLEIRKTAK